MKESICDLLTILLGDDQAKLMKSNALQILDIVKATFPHPYYEDQSIDPQCSPASSSRDELACAWKRLSDCANRKDDHEYTGAIVSAAVDVCQQPLTFSMPANLRTVLFTRTGTA